MPFRSLVLAVLLVAPVSRAQESRSPRLHFETPATSWDDALPVGNGRLGAMVFGNTARERIALNEETLWSGGPYDPTREGGAEALPEIRRLLFAGDVEKAHDLFGRTMMGMPYEQQKYQPFADLWLDFPGHGEAADYHRELDLDRAVVRVSYRVDGVTFTREVFASAPDQVIVVRITADRPGSVSFDALLTGVRNPAHSNYGTDYFHMDGLPPDTLRVTGKSSDYLGIEGALRYEGRVVARAEGGTSHVEYRTLKVRDADAVTLLFAAATSFVDYRTVSADPAIRVADVLRRTGRRSVDAIRADHVAEHRAWFRRVRLQMGDESRDDVPTDRRLAESDSLDDPGLAALAYQFGRYVLIATSRPGTQAANLQGIWNDNPNPWWDSKYTVNINLPMNYWPAEAAGLPELAGPLFDLVRDVSEAGRSVAREHWGARGWVLHQNTDLWRATAPMDGPSWGAWPVGGAWLVTHLWEHDRFAPDDAFVRAWYPVLRGQVRFLADILVEHPDNGWLVTAPSNSPENFPAFPGNGRFFDETSGLFLAGRMMQPGPTMDNQIVRAVFDAFLAWSERLGEDDAMRDEVAAQRDKLPPMQIGKHGQLQEWLVDWDELEPHHRHLSHLWGVYPGEAVTPGATPDLAAAAAVSLERRGTGGCGWSYAHKVAVQARLHRAAEAGEQVTRYLADNVLPNLFSRCGRAMQVDGSLGMTAGIGEMLLQSHDGAIDVLPALPSEWSSGTVSGLRARGGYTVDIAWRDGRPMEVVVLTSRDGRVVLRGVPTARVEWDGAPLAVEAIAPGLVAFEAVAGSTYRFLGME